MVFTTTCPRTGATTLRGASAVLAAIDGPQGLELVATCRCGGTVLLRRGQQVAHRDASSPAASVA